MLCHGVWRNMDDDGGNVVFGDDDGVAWHLLLGRRSSSSLLRACAHSPPRRAYACLRCKQHLPHSAALPLLHATAPCTHRAFCVTAAAKISPLGRHIVTSKAVGVGGGVAP